MLYLYQDGFLLLVFHNILMCNFNFITRKNCNRNKQGFIQVTVPATTVKAFSAIPLQNQFFTHLKIPHPF